MTTTYQEGHREDVASFPVLQEHVCAGSWQFPHYILRPPVRAGEDCCDLLAVGGPWGLYTEATLHSGFPVYMMNQGKFTLTSSIAQRDKADIMKKDQ